MPSVTVLGALSKTIALSFDSSQNAQLAQQLATAITAGVSIGTESTATSNFGPPPLAPDAKGEFVASMDVVTVLPRGYGDVADSAASAIIFGSGDANERILVGSGNLTFIATGGSGTVIGGGGNDQIVIPVADVGDWLIRTGGGNDTIRALGPGNDTINAGGGNNAIILGNGTYSIVSEGADTITAGAGYETIIASAVGGSHATDLVYGNVSRLFLQADGAATVFGNSGSDTVIGGTGPDLLYGGSAGNNVLRAGTGTATLFGGGNGDQLYANGAAPQQLYAGVGNETLTGVSATGQDTFDGGSGNDQITGGGGQNTYVVGSGNATITAGPTSFTALFDVVHGEAGGADTVLGLTNASQVSIELSGYGPSEAANALAGQSSTGSSVTITLSDNTRIVFENITHLTSSNFS